MKKIALLSFLLFSVISFSQAITVNTPTYTDLELVRDILVNSPCVNVRNVTSRTGTNFGSTNGVGYFQNTNPAFPFASGVVLTTGDVTKSPGPNNTILSDGTLAWAGDPALENALLAAGVTINSINATVLEFDFTSYSSYFNFQFLFASEEYGAYQCLSPDAFAFLLTDPIMSTTTNIAVIPSTSIPISVETIRNELYNSGCLSANEAYFGSFNGGAAAASSATNYNGQTVVMNANATLVPNRTYHIKIVIADNNVNNNITGVQYDSALFLGGSSFDFHQDVLGPDLTLANNTALCSNNSINDPYTITSGLDPVFFDFIWKDVSGNPIPGETGPDLTINQPGTYLLTYFIQSTACEVATNNIVIEYQQGITIPDPKDLYKCNSAQPSYSYDLSYNTTIVDPTNQYLVTYHELQTEADNNTNQLPLSYAVATASLPKQIWVRVQNPTTGCYSIKPFNLRLTLPPVANNPGNMTRCEITAGSNNAFFDLANQTPNVLLLQSSSIYTVRYYLTQNDADAGGTNYIDTSSQLLSGSIPVFVRIETTTDSNCYNTVSFNLIVKPKPVLDIIPNQYVCVSYTLPALVNPGTYYSGPNQGLPILPVGTVITTNTTVYIYHETGGTPSCPSQNSFDVTVVGVNDITPAPAPSCDTYSLPAYAYPGMHYYQYSGGPTGGPTGTNVEYAVGYAVTTVGTTTIYTYFTYTDPSCPPINSQFDVIINKTPTISNTFSNVFDCTQVNSLPVINTDIGTGNYYTFDSGTGIYTPVVFPITTQTDIFAFAENNGCRSTIYPFTVYIGSLNLPNVNLCTPPYSLTASPVGEYRTLPNGGGTVYTTPIDILIDTTIYHYVPGSSCTDDDFFTITFNKPVLTTPILTPQCESYLLPTNPDGGRYFRGQNGPGNGLTELFANVDSITTTETIWIYKESVTPLVPVCYNEIPWTININPKPVIDSRGDQVVCYNYTLTALANGNYYDDANGQNLITDFLIDATDLNAGDDIPGRIKTIYIYSENPNDANCNNENSFTITIDGIEAYDLGDQTHCDSYSLPTLPANNFYYDAPGGPLGGGNLIAVGTNYTTSTTAPLYIYTETNNRFSCKDENTFNIIINKTPILDATLPVAFNFCDSFTLPILTVGKYYNQSISNTVGRVEIPVTTYSATNLPPASIFVYAETATTPNCYIEREIPISLFNVTQLTNPPVGCGSLTLATLPALNPGENYYSSTGGSGLLNPNTPLNTTQTVFIYAVSPFGCSDETSFLVTITPTPVAFTNLIPIIDRTVCDEDALNDGITSFNLTTLNAVILGTQTTPEYTIAYYESPANATAQLSSVTSTLLTTVYVRVNNTLSLNCYDIKPITIIVNKIPDATLDPEYFICIDHDTATPLNSAILNTGLSTPSYKFAWTLNTAPYLGNTGSITTYEPGNYTVKITNISTNCDITLTTKVTPYEPYIEIAYSDAFENPTYITVNVLGAGSGNYEYRLDEGPYQDSNVFYNVSPGEHKISVNDKDGHCNPAPVEAVIINYPKFFTPNGDGFHETWNILNLKTTNPNAPILIFDRFGKLIKQITPASDGWNGKYNGQPLPATDYWFTVDYTEKGASKVFKSHFALKR